MSRIKFVALLVLGSLLAWLGHRGSPAELDAGMPPPAPPVVVVNGPTA